MSAALGIARPPSGAGLAWLKTGWNWFRPAPIPWMGMTAMVFLALLALGRLPLLGGHLVDFLSPFMVAGFMAAARAAEEGRPVTFLHLGEGFVGEWRIALAIMGGVYLAGMVAIDLTMRQLGGDGLQQMLALAQNPAGVPPEQLRTLMDQVLPAALAGLLLLTPLVMATSFAPALVLFEGFSAGNAMWWSLWACAVNWRPMLAYSLLLGLIGFVARLIPLGLGLLVFLPLVFCSTYAAYRDIFRPAEAP